MTRESMSRRLSLLAIVLVVPLASGLHAQNEGLGLRPIPTNPKAWAGVSLIFALPQDEFRSYVNNGWGLGLDYSPNIGHSGAFQLRVEGAFLQYGNETKHACLSISVGCRITVDVHTSNNILAFGLGPQLMVPHGPVRPYVPGTVGFSYFFTRSSVQGSSDAEPFAESTNFDDWIFSWTAGGGVYIPVRNGRKPIAIDAAVRYHGNGQTEYLREGSITDNGDGSITIAPVRSRTNYVAFHLGVAFGI